MNSKTAKIQKGKHKFRIFVRASDYLTADIWARDEDEANRIAREHDGGDFRMMAGDWNIEEVRKVSDDDLVFEGFRPLN
jgi:hypothetical protein